MSGQQLLQGDLIHERIIPPSSIKQEESQVPLMVAMQPGVEIPAIGVEEVVIVTEGDPDTVIEQIAIETIGNHGEMVILGREEEIDIKPTLRARISNSGYEIDDGTYARRSMVYKREGVKASKGLPPPETSASEDEEDEDSDDDSPLAMMHTSSPMKTPKKRDFAYRLQWRNKDMLDAMKCVEEKRMTLRGAAKKFLVPYSTLKDRVHGRVRHGTKPGVKTALSPEEEEELVRYIKDMEAAGFHLRNSDVRERAGELLRLNYGHSSPYGEGSSPGHNWLHGFLKRHNGLEFRRQISRTVVPSCTRQRAMIKKFYEVTAQVYKKNRITTRPERVYAVSDMKIGVFQKATIIYCASSSGVVVPPFIIFKGQLKLKLTSAREAYPTAFFTSSNTGQVTEEIFLWWFRDHFLKAIPRHGNRPLALLISQPCINVSLQMYQLAKEERVIFISIPIGVSHLLQPLDDELGVYVESCLSKKAKKWENENAGSMFTQKVLAQLLQKVWRKALTIDEVTHKFSKVGIYPLNPTAISTDKILAMSHAMRETMRRSPSPTSPLEEDEEEEDDPLQGLSLLSALSSHEYASIGRGNSSYNSHDNNQSYEEEVTPRKRILEEFETPSTSYRPSKRRRVELQDEVNNLFNRDLTSAIEPVSEKLLIEQTNIIDRPLSEVTFTKLENVPPTDVTSEITQARENLEQINRAVDSILSSEAASTSSIHLTSSRVVQGIDNAKVIRLKGPSPAKRGRPASPRRTKPMAAKSMPRTQKLPLGIPPLKKKSSKKIIFMLNKDGQLVSRTEVTPNAGTSASEILSNPSIRLSGSPSLREALSTKTVFTNIKVEDGVIREETPLPTQIIEEVVEQVVEQPDIFTSETLVTTDSNMDAGYSITNRVEEQPPQHLLQDEELDLDTVDTIMINGQLFKVIRAPKEPEVKVETSRVQVQLEDGTITEVDSNCITEDGLLIDPNATEGASVIHQEVVQDYEVASFDDSVATTQTIVEEQIV